MTETAPAASPGRRHSGPRSRVKIFNLARPRHRIQNRRPGSAITWTTAVDRCDRPRPVRPAPAGAAEFPRPGRGLYLAIAAVVVVAAAVILGMNLGSTPGATPPPASRSPSTAPSIA